jgi:hypothetical protein
MLAVAVALLMILGLRVEQVEQVAAATEGIIQQEQ